MTHRHLLVVPYFYPPFPGSGNRWPTLAKYLRRAGHIVTVLATNAFGTLPDDDELGVVRVPDLRSVGVLRRALGRGDLPVAGGAASERPPGPLLTEVIVPDANALTWLPAALARSRRILAGTQIDCLVTSGPPESTHMLGLLLGRRRPPWIADFRDGWCFEPLRGPFPTRPQRALDAWLERKVATSADVSVGATRPIAEDLARRLGAHAVYVPNAWDPEVGALSKTPTTADTSFAADQGIRLVHTGTLSAVPGRNLGGLLEALRIVCAEGRVPSLRLVLAGRLSQSDWDMIEASGAGGVVEHVGVLDRSNALALQRSADALLLVTSRKSSEATGKIFEYLGAGRPILALAEGNEAARIVRETRTGVTVPPDDVDAITTALRRLVSGDLFPVYAPRNLQRYTYPGPAEAIADAVEDAIRRRTLDRRPVRGGKGL